MCVFKSVGVAFSAQNVLLHAMRVHFPPTPISKVSLYTASFFSKIFHRSNYHQTSSPPTPTHLNYLLKSTNQTKNLKHVSQIHSQLITNTFISLPFLFNNLLNTYAKCGLLHQSLLLFATAHQVPKNVIAWTTLITQLPGSSRPFEALALFEEMRCYGVFPNHFTFSAVLPACSDTLIVFHGEQMHCLIWKHGFETHLFVSSALVHMYAKCYDMFSAQKVFDEMPERSLVSWNCMIVGFLQNECYDQAIHVFKEVIRESGFSPDQVSFSSVFSAAASMGALEFGKQVHGIVLKHGLLTLAYVKNSLMDMYSKCSCVGDAYKLFQIIGDIDVVTWNIMVNGCISSRNFEEACNFFWFMRREGITLDEVSYSSALNASASLAALDQGTLIHNQIIKSGFVKNACVTSSLITMYSKCGSLMDAYHVFEEAEDCNVICWTAMIAAYQHHGCANQVVELFQKMLGEGMKPNYITFVSVLSACSHAGLVEEGFAYFDSMTKVHGVNPGHEHFTCMVDLLGRSGRLEEAKRFVESMPIKANSSIFGALLGACRKYNYLEMGREVAEKLFKLEPDNPGNYLLLSNMYKRHGMLEEADEVRRLMGVNGVKKEPGCSWIDIKNKTFVFTVHDRSNSRTYEIYEILRKLEELANNKKTECEAESENTSAEDFEGKNLWYHSEKLALAFGLLMLPVKAPIRIKKNLRTCRHCHSVLKFASEIFERKIIVRDTNRFHHFINGLCSCKDYW